MATDMEIDAVKSVIKSEGLSPEDNNKVIKSLSECVMKTRLINVYMANAPRFRDMRYSYENI